MTRSRGSARTSTRSSPRSRRCGGSGPIRRCCSSSRRSRSRSERWPVFLLARKHLGSERAGLGFALAYLLYPPTQWLGAERVPRRSRSPRRCCSSASGTSTRIGSSRSRSSPRLACLTKEHVAARGRGARALVRARARAAAGRRGDRRGGSGSRSARDRGRRPALRAARARRRSRAATARSAARRSGSSRPRSPIPLRVSGRRSTATESRTCWSCCCRSLALPLAGAARRADGAAGARRQPALVDADADVDPLPLHGGRDSRPRGRRRVRRGAAARAAPAACARSPRRSCVVGRRLATTRSARSRVWRPFPAASRSARREHEVTAHDRVAARALAAGPRPTRSSARRTRSGGAPLRAAAHPQLPGPRARPNGSSWTRRGRATSIGSRAARDDASVCAGCGSTGAGGSSSTRTAIVVFRRRA